MALVPVCESIVIFALFATGSFAEVNLRHGCTCPAIWRPVCGTDRRTYNNLCSAGCFGVSVTYPGQCRPRNIATNCTCTLEYNPVCGSDGQTYGNPCAAECAGVTIVSNGICPKIWIIDH